MHEPLSRSDDPQTSFDAASRVNAKTQRYQIFTYLAEMGTDGATAREIALALGYELVQVDRRLPELRENGLVVTCNGKEGYGCRPLIKREGCCVHRLRFWS